MTDSCYNSSMFINISNNLIYIFIPREVICCSISTWKYYSRIFIWINIGNRDGMVYPCHVSWGMQKFISDWIIPVCTLWIGRDAIWIYRNITSLNTCNCNIKSSIFQCEKWGGSFQVAINL